MHIGHCGDSSPLSCGPQIRKVRPPWCRVRRVTVFEGETRTQQAHKDQTDVNAIVERFHRTGQLPLPKGTPQYGDVTSLQVDLTEALARSSEVIERAQEYLSSWKPPEPAVDEAPEPTPPAAS